MLFPIKIFKFLMGNLKVKVKVLALRTADVWMFIPFTGRWRKISRPSKNKIIHRHSLNIFVK